MDDLPKNSTERYVTPENNTYGIVPVHWAAPIAPYKAKINIIGTEYVFMSLRDDTPVYAPDAWLVYADVFSSLRMPSEIHKYAMMWSCESQEEARKMVSDHGGVLSGKQKDPIQVTMVLFCSESEAPRTDAKCIGSAVLDTREKQIGMIMQCMPADKKSALATIKENQPITRVEFFDDNVAVFYTRAV